MKTSSVIGIVVAVIIIGGIVWYVMGGMSAAPVPAPSAQTQDTSTGQAMPVATTSTTAAVPAAQSFVVNGNDATADLKTITVPMGTPVTITFGADAGTTYHGGLDFRSSVVNTGTIPPGGTKTVSFTATKSFSFTPYWPATNIAKPYTIAIVVQ